MKNIRFVSTRIMNTATPVILSPGRGHNVLSGYYLRTTGARRKARHRSPAPASPPELA